MVFSILALVTWGFWGFFPKLAVTHMDSRSVAFYEVIGGLIFGVIILIILGFKLQTNFYGITFGILTGFAALLGGLFFLLALSHGAKISVAVVTTALYPLITILLALFILHEPITLKQGIGAILALIAIVLISQ